MCSRRRLDTAQSTSDRLPQGQTWGGSDPGLTFTKDAVEPWIAWPGETKKYSPPPVRIRRTTRSCPRPTGLTATLIRRWPPPAKPENRRAFSELDAHRENIVRAGRYRILIGFRPTRRAHFPVRLYNDTKSVVISTVSWIAGKNTFLSCAYVGTVSVFTLLASTGTAYHLIKPRRLGDISLLSWNW
ncbi:hypothetical protein B0H11DRAFT_2260664 [Mycena galericulata]|nr:hypothetical protein B0H11DRAFT_2260664 [Mycena galericulata]